MKKTNNINLGGRAFCIDEDACLKLQNYTETLEQYYLKEEDGQEIMADIENRLAELFTDYLKEGNRGILTLNEINRAILVMGTPDAIINEDPEITPRRKKGKILYRDSDNQVLGGVAAGIAVYLSVSVVLIRILFILLTCFYGITLLLYIALWIAVPRAVTAKQKLEMKGEKINVSNIEKNIRDNYNELKEDGKIQAFFRHIGNFLLELLRAVGYILQKILTVLLGFFSVAGILCGSFLLLVFFWCMLCSASLPWGNSYFGLIHVMSDTSFLLAKITLTFIVVLPLLLIVYVSARYLTGFKIRHSIPLYAGGLWIISCLAGFIITVNQVVNFSTGHQETIEQSVIRPNGPDRKCITLRSVRNPFSNGYCNYAITNGRKGCFWNVASIEKAGQTILIQEPQLFIEKAKGELPELFIRKKARGFSDRDAIENTKAIQFNWQFKNDTLSFDDVFTINDGRKWRANEVYMTLCLPDRYQVNFVNLTADDIANHWIVQDPAIYSTHRSAPGCYVMDNGELKPVD